MTEERAEISTRPLRVYGMNLTPMAQGPSRAAIRHQ